MATNNRVIVNDRFRQVGRDVHDTVKAALIEAAHVAEATARERAAASGYNLGGVAAQITHTPPLPRRRGGWYLYVYDPDFRAQFFERGTYAKKGRKRSARQKDIEGNRGVRGIHMLRDGARAAKPVLLARLRRDLG